MSSSASVPRDIGVDREARSLTVVWEDDHRSAYPFALLRRECPCAECAGKRKAAGPTPGPAPAAGAAASPGGLRMLSPKAVRAEELDLAGLTPVGRYGLQIKWQDGHAFGIFSYTFLRALCPCGACRDERTES